MARNDVTLQQLRYFAMAAQLGSMTHAADELRVAQSAVSFAVAQLERQLDSQLFIRRRSKGLVLTPEGESFLVEANDVLGRLDESVEEARGAARQLTGQVRLACFVTLTPFVVPRLLVKIGREHPGIEVRVSEVDTDNARALLQNGLVDLAIGYDFGFGDAIHHQTIAHAQPYVALPSNHRFARRAAIALEELADEDYVLLDIPHSREYFLSLLRSRGMEPRIRYRSKSYETVRALVARGLGFSILNQKPVSTETYDGGHVTSVPLRGDYDPLPIALSRLKSVKLTARARAVAEALYEPPGAHR